MKPIRVCFFIQDLRLGGVSRWVTSLCRQFDPLKVTASSIVTWWSGDDVFDPLTLSGLPPDLTLYRGGQFIYEASKHVDVILTWCVMNLDQILAGCRLPVIFVAHGLSDDVYSFLIIRSAIDARAKLTAVAVSCLEGFPEDARGSVHIIPNGAELERVTPTVGRETARRELGITDDERVLLFIGRLVPDKRIAEMLLALDYLPEQWRAVVCGPTPPSMLDLRQLRLKYRRRVIVLPPREYVGDLLAAGDVFCLVSWREGHPIALTEAWLAGIPAVVTHLPFVQWAHGRHGMMNWTVSPSFQPTELATSILAAAQAGRDGEYPMRARAVALEHYTASSMARRWEDEIIATFDRSEPAAK